MKNRLILISLLSLTLTYPKMSLAYDKLPVDEGLNNKPKESKIKGITFENTKKLSKATIYLSKESSIILIKFKEVSFAPLICKIKRDNKEIWSSKAKTPINPKKSRGLIFTIDKNKLKDGDIIIILNNQNNIIQEIKVFQ